MHNIKKYIWTFLLGIFVFHGVLEDTIPILNVFDECIALLCFPLALMDYIKTKGNRVTRLAKSRRMEFVLLVAFLLCGLLRNIMYRFQPIWVV